MSIAYKRILLKLSGEVLAGEKKTGIDNDTVVTICKSVKKIADMGVEVGIVVGGGNFWRGRTSEHMDRTRADHIGMLATAMNSLALCDALEQLGADVRVQTAIEMRQIADLISVTRQYVISKRAELLFSAAVPVHRSFQQILPLLCVRLKLMPMSFLRLQMLTAFMIKTLINLTTQLSLIM